MTFLWCRGGRGRFLHVLDFLNNKTTLSKVTLWTQCLFKTRYTMKRHIPFLVWAIGMLVLVWLTGKCTDLSL